MNRRRSRAIVPALFILAGVLLPACQTIHSDMSDAEIDRHIRHNFRLGMSPQATWSRMQSMGLEPHDAPEGDIYAVVRPASRPLIFDYEGRRQVLFRFHGDDALDDVLYDQTRVIELEPPR